jgi:hypothetical protein
LLIIKFLIQLLFFVFSKPGHNKDLYKIDKLSLSKLNP